MKKHKVIFSIASIVLAILAVLNPLGWTPLIVNCINSSSITLGIMSHEVYNELTLSKIYPFYFKKGIGDYM